MRWISHTRTHSLSFFSISFSHSIQFSWRKSDISLGIALFFYYFMSWWQPAGVREIEIDMRADSVYHISPQSDRKVPDLSLSLSMCVCVLSLFLSNLKRQLMKSAVICVDWDHIKSSLVCKGWRDCRYIGLDNRKILMLILNVFFFSLFICLSFSHLIQDICLIWVHVLWMKHQPSYSVIY